MTRGHPGLGRQILEIDPQRAWLLAEHGLHMSLGQGTGESLDDDRARLDLVSCQVPLLGAVGGGIPPPQLDSGHLAAGLFIHIDHLGTDALQHTPVIDPQAHCRPRTQGQVPCQAPANADIPKIIHNLTEDFPLRPCRLVFAIHHCGYLWVKEGEDL